MTLVHFMKVDKDNPKHWLLLILSGLIVFAAMPFRVFRDKSKKRVVFFYQMHGNSKALAEYIEQHDETIERYFLAFPQYLKIYEGKQDLPTLSMLSLRDMIKVAQCSVLVTNYEILTLLYFAKFTNIKFVDTWHGIPMLKNQTPKILHYLNYYEEVWVSSPAMKVFYEQKYELTSRIIPTGYGRVDKLVNGSYQDVKKKYSIPPNKKVIMIAPTWKQNDPDRSALPFGMDEQELVSQLNTFAKTTGTFIIFRAHMLSGEGITSEYSQNVRSMPTQDYPDAEELLSITDILVTDWSSLVFDFMVLDRPVIFIDINAPFQGEDLARRSSPRNRFGTIVSTFDEFGEVAQSYLKNPKEYLQRHAKQIEQAKKKAYGGLDDGLATERYYARLVRMLRNDSSN